MNGSKLIKSLAATIVVMVLGGPAVVLANTSIYIEDGKVSVSYADLNLESEQSVRVLYGRLQRASKRISSQGPHFFKSLGDWMRPCRKWLAMCFKMLFTHEERFE